MTQWTNDTVVVDGATVRYRTTGEGPTIVFVHGVYVGGSLWDALVERLPGFRCIVPTWPLGANVDHSPTADLSALAAAARIPHFLAALDLHDVTAPDDALWQQQSSQHLKGQQDLEQGQQATPTPGRGSPQIGAVDVQK